MRRMFIRFIFVGLVLVLPLSIVMGQATEEPTFETVVSDDETYSVEIPAGWTADLGGVEMFGNWLPVFVASSEDNSQNVLYGLFSPVLYVEPSEAYTEDETVDLDGSQVEVRPYVPADEYFSEWIEGNNIITFDDCTEEPQIEVVLNAEPVEVPEGSVVEFDAVTIDWTCPSTDGYVDRASAYLRMAQLDWDESTRVWFVDAFATYIAPDEQFDALTPTLDHIVMSVTPNQDLAQMDEELDEYTDAMSYAIEMTGLLGAIYANR